MNEEEIAKETEVINKCYPKLKRIYSHGKLVELMGDLDITDIEDNYLETYEISITLPPKFPFAVPEVREVSTLIPRIVDRHISPTGVCCLDIEHELLHMASFGIKLDEFIGKKIYPFFANQVFYNACGHFAGKEYQHGDKGVAQFYFEKLNFTSFESIVKVLSRLLKFKKFPQRDALCFCSSNKLYKDCHEGAVLFLQKMPISRIKVDLKIFKSRI